MSIDILQFVAEVVTAILKHGWSLTTIAVVVTALLRFSPFRLLVMRYLPKKFRRIDDRMDRIESKVDALLSAGGITWNAGKSNLSADGEKSISKSPWEDTSRATIANAYTRRESTTISRGNRKMKEYLKKLGRTKFQALIVSLVVNITSAVLFMNGTLDIDGVINQYMPIINMTIGTISTWVYIAVEGSIDKANATKEVSNASYTSPEDAGNI